MSKSLYVSLDLKLTGQRIRTVMIEHGYTVRQIQEKLVLYFHIAAPVFRQRITFTG